MDENNISEAPKVPKAPKLKPGKHQSILIEPNFGELYGKRLKRDCKTILRAYKALNSKKLHAVTRGRFLFRSTEDKPNAYIGRPYADRTPKDTSDEIHEELIELMIKNGFKAHRGNSIFTTASLAQAQDYGSQMFVIFPIDGFHFSWSTKHDDLFSSVLDGVQSISELSDRHTALRDDFENLFSDLDGYSTYYEDLPPKLRNIVIKNHGNLVDWLEMLSDEYEPEPVTKKVVVHMSKLFSNWIKNQKHMLELYKKMNPNITPPKQKLTRNSGANPTSMIRDYKILIPQMARLLKLMEKNLKAAPVDREILNKLGLVADKDLLQAIKSEHEVIINGPYYAFRAENHMDYDDEEDEGGTSSNYNYSLAKWISSL